MCKQDFIDSVLAPAGMVLALVMYATVFWF